MLSNGLILLCHIYAREWDVLLFDLKKIKKLLDILCFKNYVKMLLNYTKIIYVFQDTPHFICNTKSEYNKCFGVLEVNATINLFPIIKSQRIRYINMNKYICNENKLCKFIINKTIVYKDNNHLSVQFVASLKEQLLQQFKLNLLDKKILYNKTDKWFTCLDLYLLQRKRIKETSISWYK